MSAMTHGSTARTLALPLRSPLPGRTAAPRKAGALRLVPQRRSSAAKAPFVVVVVTLLVGGLLGLLLLNTLVAQGSFALHDLNKNGKALQQQEQSLADQVQALQAPAELATRATSLGMVPGGPPAFLRLPDGAVLGQPMAGVAPVVPKPVVTQPTTPTTTTTATTTSTTGTTKASTTWTGPKKTPPTTSTTTKRTATKTTTTTTTTHQPTGAHR